MMSRGTTLLSRGTVEADRWLDLGQGCAIHRAPAPCQSGASMVGRWDTLPEQCKQQRSHVWVREGGPAKAITSLIRDLSLVDSSLGSPLTHATHATSTPTAPPSKRQCRSLSFSDEFGGCRSHWRPQGSRVWTTVEKRRCHSGGSVQRCPGGGFSGGHFPAMQRSSSFSLPSRSSKPTEGVLEMPCFAQGLPLHPLFTASPVSPTSPPLHHHYHQQHHSLRPLSLSHEQISLSELQSEEQSEASSPDSTPELGRRAGKKAGGAGGLPRSRSQPCVGNHKKIGMKRRRPEEAQEARPSLDLAKMTQKLQTSHSLSWPGTSGYDSARSNQCLPGARSVGQSDSDFISMSDLELDTRPEGIGDEEEDSSFEELDDSDSACGLDSRPGSPGGLGDDGRTLWEGHCGAKTDIFQLGGELDIEQIERN
ncbi:protein FAM53B-like isoform 2-T2 [Aplochiton taeniatus]